MEFYYEQSENNSFDKTKGGLDFFELKVNKIYSKKIKYLTEGFDYIITILNLYLKSPYFNEKQKKNLSNFKNKINKQKYQLLMKIK